MFGEDVHGDFGEVKIGADAGGGDEAGFVVDCFNDVAGEFFGSFAGEFEVASEIDEDFVDGVAEDVFGGDEGAVDVFEDAVGIFEVFFHAGRGDEVFEVATGLIFILASFFFDFEEPATAAEAEFFEAGGDGEANGAVGAGEVGDDEVGGHWVEAAFDAFDRGVERFEIDGSEVTWFVGHGFFLGCS